MLKENKNENYLINNNINNLNNINFNLNCKEFINDIIDKNSNNINYNFYNYNYNKDNINNNDLSSGCPIKTTLKKKLFLMSIMLKRKE